MGEETNSVLQSAAGGSPIMAPGIKWAATSLLGVLIAFAVTILVTAFSATTVVLEPASPFTQNGGLIATPADAKQG
jgi:hypothetical protein